MDACHECYAWYLSTAQFMNHMQGNTEWLLNINCSPLPLLHRCITMMLHHSDAKLFQFSYPDFQNEMDEDQ